MDENQLFIQATFENQNQGKLDDCVQYIQLLHQNLLFLAAVGDCLPAPPQPPSSTQQQQPVSQQPSQQQQQQQQQQPPSQGI